MVDIAIREATTADAVHLAPLMREADRDEVYAASGMSPLAGLLASMQGGQESWSGLVDGNLTVLFGLKDNKPWLLGSDGVASIPVPFLRRSRSVVAVWRDRYGRIGNHVDARNHVSVAWLQWLGFEIGVAEPYGFRRLPFHPFWMG